LITRHQAKYFAHALTQKHVGDESGRLTQALFNASVDLNPHQIEAALFALKSPLSKGALLADEVGLGKTIEAGIVLCQYWAEHKRKLVVITPASLRKQWAVELEEKFALKAFVLDAKTHREEIRAGRNPFEADGILILSYPYANKLREEIKASHWDLVVIDEAHKLRNAYRESNKIGRGIRWAFEDTRKILLTATPLQNSLLELYGLSTLIDEHIFGDVDSFRAQYVSQGGDLAGLRDRLASFTHRTLRSEVSEYIRYTSRFPLTFPFEATDAEQLLYDEVSDFLRRPESIALPNRQRHLLELIIRKQLASSATAVAGTLAMIRGRLEQSKIDEESSEDLVARLFEQEELEPDLAEDFENVDGDVDFDELIDLPSSTLHDAPLEVAAERRAKMLEEEIAELARLEQAARTLHSDTKAQALLTALSTGFTKMKETGAAHKALIFTESRRTQEYLREFLEENGYKGDIVLFSGSNGGAENQRIYESWLARNTGTSRSTGSRAIDIRTALVERFRDSSSIMIATEAAAEGVNLQFCSMVVNYDLPWNPQRVEQRIGRCHRYGQQHDVVVINFVNQRNHADRRVLELLEQKFSLFHGVFGSSDDVLGSIESGIDFEKQILAIYQRCRTTEEIEDAFDELQNQMESSIQARMLDTRRALLENFDEDVHQRLQLRLESTQASLDRFGRMFWQLTKFILSRNATFNNDELFFDLDAPPSVQASRGRYHLISKNGQRMAEGGDEVAWGPRYIYRLSHPLGEHVLAAAKELRTDLARLEFDITRHPTRISVVESLVGKSGFLTLTKLSIDSFDREEHLLLSGVDADGGSVDHETLERLLSISCAESDFDTRGVPTRSGEHLRRAIAQHTRATINRSLEINSEHLAVQRDRLDRWADDLILASEQSLRATKEQIKAAKRAERQAITVEEQLAHQRKIKKLERQRRTEQQQIFMVENEIEDKRDELISAIEKRLTQRTVSEELFTIEWAVV